MSDNTKLYCFFDFKIGYIIRVHIDENQIKSNQINWLRKKKQIKSNQINRPRKKIKSNQIKSMDPEKNQIKSNQINRPRKKIKSNQIKSNPQKNGQNQIKSNQVDLI